MAKVVMFPQKKKLPKGMEENLIKIAKDYVATLHATVMIMDLELDAPTQEEIMELVQEAFTKGIYEAIDEMDEL